MNVLVCGFGNAGTGIAADLALQGHEISVLKTSPQVHSEHFRTVCRSKSNRLKEGNATHVGVISLLTSDPTEAFERRPDIVLVTTQTLYHQSVFKKIIPFLSHGMIVLLEPGNAGSLLLSRENIDQGVTIAEATSTPIDVRIEEPGTARVLFRNVRNPLGFLPESASAAALERLRRLYSNFYSIGHVLSAALHNPNLIVHTIGCLLSLPRIEYSKGEFWMYKEGFTDSVWNVIDSLDSEKVAVLQQLEGVALPYLEMAKLRNSADLSLDAKEVFKFYCATGSPKGPSDSDSRYIHEDVPKGLVLLESLGSLTGCPTKTASMLIDLAETYTRKDFRCTGSNQSRLGVLGKRREELLAWLKSGAWPTQWNGHSNLA